MNGDAGHVRPGRPGGGAAPGFGTAGGDGKTKIDMSPDRPDHARGEARQHEAETLANTVTKEIAERVNAHGEIFITPSTTAGKTFIRVVNGNPNASEEYARKAFDIIVRMAEEVLGQWNQEGNVRN